MELHHSLIYTHLVFTSEPIWITQNKKHELLFFILFCHHSNTTQKGERENNFLYKIIVALHNVMPRKRFAIATLKIHFLRLLSRNMLFISSGMEGENFNPLNVFIPLREIAEISEIKRQDFNC